VGAWSLGRRLLRPKAADVQAKPGPGPGRGAPGRPPQRAKLLKGGDERRTPPRPARDASLRSATRPTADLSAAFQRHLPFQGRLWRRAKFVGIAAAYRRRCFSYRLAATYWQRCYLKKPAAADNYCDLEKIVKVILSVIVRAERQPCGRERNLPDTQSRERKKLGGYPNLPFKTARPAKGRAGVF